MVSVATPLLPKSCPGCPALKPPARETACPMLSAAKIPAKVVFLSCCKVLLLLIQFSFLTEDAHLVVASRSHLHNPRLLWKAISSLGLVNKM